MEKGNICMEMVVIIMEIGLKAKWKEMENFMILMEIFNIKDNGKMIIIMVKAHYMGLMMQTGLNMLGILKLVKWMDLDKCFSKMEINIKDNSGMIALGEKVECF